MRGGMSSSRRVMTPRSSVARKTPTLLLLVAKLAVRHQGFSMNERYRSDHRCSRSQRAFALICPGLLLALLNVPAITEAAPSYSQPQPAEWSQHLNAPFVDIFRLLPDNHLLVGAPLDWDANAIRFKQSDLKLLSTTDGSVLWSTKRSPMPGAVYSVVGVQNHNGTVREEMVLNVDVPQTLLELAGIAVPSTMQGRSVLPLAQGRSVADWRKDWLYEYYEYPAYENVRPHRGVRTEQYKYIHFFIEPQEYELYDLQVDPAENNNLYGKPGYEQLTVQLAARLETLRQETGDQYAYHPSRSAHLKLIMGPPEEPPHR
jgi:hypothetical protein